MATYQEIVCQNACNPIKGRFPYRWDLNVYRGCAHSCRYCFALYTHSYLGSADYFGDIYVKTNIVEKLERQLRSPNWEGAPINLGGVTDSYQPAEKQYAILPEIWKLLIRYKNPAMISTKSDLILRDYDLIDELSRLTYVNVACTITAADEEIRKKIESGGVPTSRRFEVLREFKKTKAVIGVHMMPIIPCLTDRADNLESLMRSSRELSADYIITQLLNLRGPTRGVFLFFIKKDFPEFYPRLCKLYEKGRLDPEYQHRIYRAIHMLRETYGLSNDYRKPMTQRLNREVYEQLSLFSE